MAVGYRTVVCAPCIHEVVCRLERAFAVDDGSKPSAGPCVVRSLPENVRNLIGKIYEIVLPFFKWTTSINTSCAYIDNPANTTAHNINNFFVITKITSCITPQRYNNSHIFQQFLYKTTKKRKTKSPLPQSIVQRQETKLTHHHC